MTTSPSRPLQAYLNDHLAAATAGVRLFDAAQATWRGTAHEETFRHLREQIAGEREELCRVMAGLGFSSSNVKIGLAVAGAQISKVNPVNLLRSRNGTAAQLELESLQTAVRAQECLWETLLAVAPHDPRLDADHLREVRDLTRRQQQQIADVMRVTAPDRFPRS